VIESLRTHHASLHEATRATRVLELLERMLAERQRGSLRQMVEWLWIELGGPACIDEAALEDAERFFQLLETIESGGVVASMTELEARLKMLYASPRSGAEAERVQIMTIYKSKGLEFDSVIVPQLGARPRSDESELVRLTEVAVGRAQVEFLIAPRQRAGDPVDPFYELAHEFNRDRAANELDRLLYVACTRAVKRLHLLGAAEFKEAQDCFAARKSSLLARLWPVCSHDFGDDQKDSEQALSGKAVPARMLQRLPDDWQAPAKTPPIIERGDVDVEHDFEVIEYSWAGEEARQLGIVVHDAMLRLSQEGADHWDQTRIDRAVLQWRAEFRRAGASEAQLEALTARTTTAVSNTLTDEDGQWIVSRQHQQAQSEFALTAVLDGVAQQLVVDRSFVDEADVRWIIDYKTSRHTGSDIDAFIASEKDRYYDQMARYGRAFSILDENRKIRLGLYFPLLKRFVHWEHTSDTHNGLD